MLATIKNAKATAIHPARSIETARRSLSFLLINKAHPNNIENAMPIAERRKAPYRLCRGSIDHMALSRLQRAIAAIVSGTPDLIESLNMAAKFLSKSNNSTAKIAGQKINFEDNTATIGTPMVRMLKARKQFCRLRLCVPST